MSFVLQPGVYGIIGPNGAGKSTLLQMITTNLTQYEGTISYCGDEIKRWALPIAIFLAICRK
ncbi:MAG: ATP-binding cassette domain-containing protein [Ruminococcus sp.]